VKTDSEIHEKNLKYLGEEKKERKKEREERNSAVSRTLAKRCGVRQTKLGFGTSTDSRH